MTVGIARLPACNPGDFAHPCPLPLLGRASHSSCERPPFCGSWRALEPHGDPRHQPLRKETPHCGCAHALALGGGEASMCTARASRPRCPKSPGAAVSSLPPPPLHTPRRCLVSGDGEGAQ